MSKTKILGYTLAIAISLLFVQCTSKHKKLNQELNKTAAELNLSTPVALEAHTRFDSVGVTPDNVFQYFYTITDIANPHELLRNKKEEMIVNLKNEYANDKALQFFRKHKVTMEYIYRDTMQNVIDVITIETDNYKNY